MRRSREGGVHSYQIMGILPCAPSCKLLAVRNASAGDLPGTPWFGPVEQLKKSTPPHAFVPAVTP